MATVPPVLQVDRLSVTLGTRDGTYSLVENFSLKVAAGGATGLVGETGAGKSLAMRAAVGLLAAPVQAVAGTIAFQGSELPAGDGAALRSRLGHGMCLLLQNGRGALNPFLTVARQVDRVLRRRGLASRLREVAARELMGAVGLPYGEFAQRYPHQLSGGQAQRVAMVIALATEPSVLIADEPTTALDVTTQRDTIALLQRLCRERNMGLVLITHNLALVSQTCDQVVLMHAGHVVEAGPTRKTFDNPLHPYTRALIKAIPDVDHPAELVPLRGSVPARTAIGQGCRFAERCDHARDICRDRSDVFEVGGRQVRCILHAPPGAG
jgi:oligopeptide/dipeptide ABC transporter ATP-binding protein